jgi:hypothetical protein
MPPVEAAVASVEVGEEEPTLALATKEYRSPDRAARAARAAREAPEEGANLVRRSWVPCPLFTCRWSAFSGHGATRGPRWCQIATVGATMTS